MPGSHLWLQEQEEEGDVDEALCGKMPDGDTEATHTRPANLKVWKYFACFSKMPCVKVGWHTWSSNIASTYMKGWLEKNMVSWLYMNTMGHLDD